jgi:hypothetical protein
MEEEDGHGPREMQAVDIKILQSIRRGTPMDKI